MTSGQARFPIAPSKFKFSQYGRSGMWVSELLPTRNGRRHVLHPQHEDRSHQSRAGHQLHADRQPDHGPALPGLLGRRRAGVDEEDLPTFVVLVAKPTNTEQVQAISARLWSAGYLPGEHAGVRSAPAAIRSCTSTIRPAFLGGPSRHAGWAAALNELNYSQVGDPETHTRIQQYELAFRMQSSVAELTEHRRRARVDVSNCMATTARKPGSSANRCYCAAGWSSTAALCADLSERSGHPRQHRRPVA